MSGKPKLVIGANGFLGSHVTRQLVADGAQVRAMVRAGANTRGIDDLSLTRFHGDVFDTAVLSEAMDGVDDVYYCVVDTRAWLRDTSPLFRTNVEGLRNVLDVAVTQPELRKFIFTSTYATVGRRRGHVATEDDVIGTRGLSDYVKSRVQAENLVMRYVAEAGLPAVAMCVSTTYGSGDWGRTRTAPSSPGPCSASCRSPWRASSWKSSASPTPRRPWSWPPTAAVSASGT